MAGKQEQLKDHKENNPIPSSPPSKPPDSGKLPCQDGVAVKTNPNLVKKEIDKISLVCEHSGRKIPELLELIELVPKDESGEGFFSKPVEDVVFLIWSGPKYPGNITVTPSVKIVDKGKYKVHFPYNRNIIDLKKGSLMRAWNSIFTSRESPNSYTIDGAPSGSINVRVYNPDQYKLTIKIPKLGKSKSGSKWGSGQEETSTKDKRAGVTTTNEVSPSGEKTFSVSNSDTKKEYKIDAGIAVMSEKAISKGSKVASATIGKDKPIVLDRNGKPMDLDIVESIGFILTFVSSVYSLIKLVQDSVPKIGWYYEWELEYWQGTFELEWGWQESKDHTAFYHLVAKIDIAIISGKFEIGFGVDVGAFVAQIYGFANGSLNLSLKGEQTGPGEIEIPLELSGKLSGGIGGRVEVGCILKGELVAEVGITGKVNGGYKTPGLNFGLEISWTGIVARLEAGLGKGGFIATKVSKSNKTWKLVSGDKLYTKEFPFIDKYTPEILILSEISNVISEIFDKGWSIRVKDDLGTVIPNNRISLELAKFIHERNDISKNRKSIEAIAHEIRHSLEIKSIKKWERDWMSYSQLNEFEKSELPGILDKAKSQEATLLASVKG